MTPGRALTICLAYKTARRIWRSSVYAATADGVWLGSWVNRQRQVLNSAAAF